MTATAASASTDTPSSAVPDHLTAFARHAGILDHDLAAVAGRLERALDAFAVTRPESVAVPTLGPAVRRHHEESARLNDWVGRVGQAFAAADRGAVAWRPVVVADAAAIDRAVGFASVGRARAGARVDAIALEEIVDRYGHWLFGHQDSRAFRRTYPRLVEVLARVRAHAGDPDYADTLLEELGADVVQGLLTVLIHHGRSLLFGPGRARAGGPDPFRDLVRPVAEVVAAADRTGRVDDVLDALLRASDTPAGHRQLALLLAGADATPRFVAAAAERLLVPDRSANFPERSALLISCPDLAAPHIAAMGALERNREAAFLFVTRARNVEAVLRPPDAELAPDASAYRAAAARVLELALVHYPLATGRAADAEAAGSTFARAVRSVARKGVAGELRPALATAMVAHIDHFARAIDANHHEPSGATPLAVSADQAGAFFADVTRDDRALATITVGIANYLHREAAAGLAQDLDPRLDFSAALADEGQRVGELLGAVAAGLGKAEGRDRDRQAFAVAAMKTATTTLSSLALTAAPVSGGMSVVAGLGVKGLSDAAGRVVEEATRSRVISPHGYLEAVLPSLTHIVGRAMYDNPNVRAAIAGDDPGRPPPAETFEAWMRRRKAADAVMGAMTTLRAHLLDRYLVEAVSSGAEVRPEAVPPPDGP